MLGVLHQEEKLRGKPGYEHLNDPLHVIVEAELPADIVDRHLARACAIINELLRPMVRALPPYSDYLTQSMFHAQMHLLMFFFSWILDVHHC